ncbi:MAG: L-2-amino-thiazoline-4-carboxylic acid hydrolase [Candidatus Heimdallarchaeota archaeon]
MSEERKMISINEATEEVEVAIKRLALMHLSYAKILVKELGKEKGKEIIIKAITEYGVRIGENIAKGGRDLPRFGVHKEVFQNEQGEYIVKGCTLAKVFREYDELELGSLYCYVDPAKSMTTDPSQKIIHRTCEACGDEKCTLAIVPTLRLDREILEKRNEDLKLLNPYLITRMIKE